VEPRFGVWNLARNAEQAQKLYGSPKNPRNGSNCAKIDNDGQSSHTWIMTFSGDNAAQEQNHAGGGGKQREVEKKRQTWVLRNGGFQFGG
jgi:hypothetical protein